MRVLFREENTNNQMHRKFMAILKAAEEENYLSNLLQFYTQSNNSLIVSQLLCIRIVKVPIVIKQTPSLVWQYFNARTKYFEIFCRGLNSSSR